MRRGNWSQMRSRVCWSGTVAATRRSASALKARQRTKRTLNGRSFYVTCVGPREPMSNAPNWNSPPLNGNVTFALWCLVNITQEVSFQYTCTYSKLDLQGAEITFSARPSWLTHGCGTFFSCWIILCKKHQNRNFLNFLGILFWLGIQYSRKLLKVTLFLPENAYRLVQFLIQILDRWKKIYFTEANINQWPLCWPP